MVDKPAPYRAKQDKNAGKNHPLLPVEQIRKMFRCKEGWRRQSHCADTLKITRGYFGLMINGEREGRPLEMSKEMQRRISDYLAVYK